jgi:hypothetical protein
MVCIFIVPVAPPLQSTSVCAGIKLTPGTASAKPVGTTILLAHKSATGLTIDSVYGPPTETAGEKVSVHVLLYEAPDAHPAEATAFTV